MVIQFNLLLKYFKNHFIKNIDPIPFYQAFLKL